MLTILCWLPPHPYTVHLEVSKISTHLCWLRPTLIWSDPKNPSTRFNGWNSTTFFSKILKFSGHLFWVWRHPPTQFTPTARPASLPVWEFIMTDDDCHILSIWACKCPVWLRHLNQRHKVVQSLTKLNNKI